jgi:uncharacterized protein
MSFSPIEHTASLRIGVVEFVSPDEIKVALDLEAPDGIAANAGVPRAFPRINGYALISTEAGYIVGQIEWIAVERSPFPKRKGFQDYGLVDLPYPLRKMRINPLGILKTNQNNKYFFKRGVQAFPSVGEPVFIPTDNQLIAIVESGEKRRIKIGTSPLAANAEVYVDPDRLFGRHLAILGNTGSGKSCTVAGLIQWSLKEAKEFKKDTRQNPNARFIILDPNGEYVNVFKKHERIFQVNADKDPLQVPLWFWNSSEWSSFTQASVKAQVPLLKRSLRSMRNEEFEIQNDLKIEAKRFVGIILQSCIASKNSGEPFKQFPHSKNFIERLKRWQNSVDDFNSRITENLDSLSNKLQTEYDNHRKVQSNNFIDYNIFVNSEVESLISEIRTTYKTLGGLEHDLLPKNEDIPIKFSGEVFINYIEGLAQEEGNEQYVEFLLARIRTMLSDTRMKPIIGDEIDINLEDWLNNYIGKNDGDNGCVTVIDLSLVPLEIIHIIIAVVARITFEALQRYRKLEGKSLPTVLVMEEAHTFIKKYKEDAEGYSAADVCCQVFERIAREGRKFGLGLVLSSQRPSELSQTVLSQCNTFLLHRISNDRDQELVNRLVPDNLRGLLRELPSLPSQQAILLGWASELPVMVNINFLAENERPHSDDPDFWDVWTGKDANGNDVKRNIDWNKIVNDWQQKYKAKD